MRAEALQTAWFRGFFGALSRAGVTDVVASPGSRSTPLVAAAVHEPGLDIHTLYDERSAAFFALGQARVTGRPSVLVRTSGSAGAHDLPAVLEASYAHLPLIVVTADRPPELQGAGAPQTMDQRHLFQPHVRADFELGMADRAGLGGAVRKAVQAVHASLHVPGPVHVNAPCRKPLEPAEPRDEAEAELAGEVQARLQRPFRCVGARSTFDPNDLVEVAARIDAAEHPWLVAGPHIGGPPPVAEVERFTRHTGAVLAAETASGLRHGGPPGHDGFAWPLRHRQPDLVVLLGAWPASRSLQQVVETARVRVGLHPHGVMDPTGFEGWALVGDPADALRQLAERCRPATADRRQAFETLRARDQALWRTARDPGFTEAGAARTILEHLPPEATLFLGNSLAIRSVDRFVPATDRSLRVLHQRGLNGIDGLVSGAAGAASRAKGPTLALLGDVSFLHDLSGLEAAALAVAVSGRPLVLAVIHNGGGRIFDELPLARTASPGLMAHFVTPHRKSFRGLSEVFSVDVCPVGDRDGLEEALARAFAAPRVTVLQIDVPADGAAQAGRAFEAAAAEVRGGR
jgi:2-succinyl-5-enolpyruvyl-6-hydroxy-3-cyclohexene-1-carboxylate synthase